MVEGANVVLRIFGTFSDTLMFRFRINFSIVPEQCILNLLLLTGDSSPLSLAFPWQANSYLYTPSITPKVL
jgi:hypothetical protein